ncbi:MAG: hypothetical protein IPK03_05415 [Bacteroidetes bacterium]|nr:hypothetical protein [Bacteroidota bacterium]
MNAQAALRSIQHPSCENDKYTLHPCLQKRLIACDRGWMQANLFKPNTNNREKPIQVSIKDCEKRRYGSLSFTNNTNYKNYEVWIYINNQVSPYQKLKPGLNSTVTFSGLSGFVKYEIRGFGMSPEQINTVQILQCKNINIKIWSNAGGPTITDIEKGNSIRLEVPNENSETG